MHFETLDVEECLGALASFFKVYKMFIVCTYPPLQLMGFKLPKPKGQ